MSNLPLFYQFLNTSLRLLFGDVFVFKNMLLSFDNSMVQL